MDKEAESKGELAIHTFFKQIPIKEKRMEHIQQELLQDEELSILMQIIENGWPENQKDAPVSTNPYWNYRDELVVNNGLILKGERVVIPKALRPEMLRQLHLSHLGIVKTKEGARTVMFWPNITGDIEKMINAYDTCCKFQNRQQKDHLINMEIPSYPFQHVGADLFTFRGQEYPITTDYYS